MQGFNLIIVFNQKEDRLLMCERANDPYQGKTNFVGGKIEHGENGIDAAYRELFEETEIAKSDIELYHMMDFVYYIADCFVEVYVGKLNKETKPKEEKHKLFWTDLTHNFFDPELYAGEGNIGHMLEIINLYKNKLFKEK